MSITDPKSESIVERGKRIYDQRLRSILEPEHNGEYVVIDVDTGEYELDKDHLAASDRAHKKKPGKVFYAAKVGFPTLGHIRSPYVVRKK